MSKKTAAIIITMSMFLLLYIYNSKSEDVPVTQENSETYQKAKLKQDNKEIKSETFQTTTEVAPSSDFPMEDNAPYKEDEEAVNYVLYKTWPDGSLTFRSGENYITVTADGVVQYLPKQL